MKKNVGKPDRTIRTLLGILFIAMGFFFSGWWAVLGIVLLVTAAIGWCPLYTLLGLKTCKAESC